MKAMELFQKWNGGRNCTPLEAWMAGFAAGCHRGYRKGHGKGLAVGQRERRIILAALEDVYRHGPIAFESEPAPQYDDRDDGYLLQKLLSRHRAQSAGGND